MIIAGYTTGRTSKTVESVRSVSLVTRWIHEIFTEGKAVPMGEKTGSATPDIQADETPQRLG